MASKNRYFTVIFCYIIDCNNVAIFCVFTAMATCCRSQLLRQGAATLLTPPVTSATWRVCHDARAYHVIRLPPISSLKSDVLCILYSSLPPPPSEVFKYSLFNNSHTIWNLKKNGQIYKNNKHMGKCEESWYKK